MVLGIYEGLWVFIRAMRVFYDLEGLWGFEGSQGVMRIYGFWFLRVVRVSECYESLWGFLNVMGFMSVMNDFEGWVLWGFIRVIRLWGFFRVMMVFNGYENFKHFLDFW